MQGDIAFDTTSPRREIKSRVTRRSARQHSVSALRVPEILTSLVQELLTVHSRNSRSRAPARNDFASARTMQPIREISRGEERLMRFASSPFRFSPSTLSRARARASVFALCASTCVRLLASFIPSALARVVSGFPKRFPETEMLALAMQALSLVPRRFPGTHGYLLSLSLSLSLAFLFTFPPPPPCGTRFSRSVSPSIPLAVLCILLPHDKCRANIRDSHS